MLRPLSSALLIPPLSSGLLLFFGGIFVMVHFFNKQDVETQMNSGTQARATVFERRVFLKNGNKGYTIDYRLVDQGLVGSVDIDDSETAPKIGEQTDIVYSPRGDVFDGRICCAQWLPKLQEKRSYTSALWIGSAQSALAFLLWTRRIIRRRRATT